MINKKYILLFIFITITIKADFSLRDWEFKKRITISDFEGVASVKVDAEVYNHSKQDLSDIRVVSGKGEEIPYKTEPLESKKETVCFEPKLYNLSNVPDKYTEFYLDVGEDNQIINKLHIVTPNKNFRRKVEIWGSDNGINWLKIREDANIFSFYTEDYRTSLTEFNFPDTKRRYLKIVIWNNKEGPLRIDGCWVYHEKVVEAKLDEIPFLIVSRNENYEKKRTEVILDVVYRNIPKKELNLVFASGGYYRSVWVFGSEDAENWRRLNSAVIYMFNKKNRNNIISLSDSRDRYLKLFIYNQDDPPLKIDNISIKGYRQIIYFPVKKDKKYYLFYGNSDVRRPIYEFERLLPFMESEKAITADLGKEQVNEDFSRIKEVIKEDEKLLIWPMVTFVVLTLGFLIVKSLNSIKKKREREKKLRWKKR
jgi:predicted transposase YbfD/YdcC